jgi:Alternative complex III, ActD subunit
MPDRLLAEYRDEDAIAGAIRRLHDAGYRRLEAYLPFPSHEVEHALAARRSRLPLAIFVCGICGACGGYALQWLLVAYLYPLDAGGRPPHFPLAFVIITFEMGVLFAALCAFFGTLALGRLVRLTDAVQGTPGFESVTRDRFWLEVSLADPAAADGKRTRDLLHATGALRIELVGPAP